MSVDGERGQHMDKNLQSAALGLGDQLAELIEAHTLEPALGRVWAALLMRGDDQDADALAELLGEDPELVEDTLAQLVELGAVHAGRRGHRAETDPMRIAASFVRAKELPLIAQLEDALRFARDRLAKSSDPQAAQARARVDELVRQVSLSQRLLRAVASSSGLELDRLLGALGG